MNWEESTFDASKWQQLFGEKGPRIDEHTQIYANLATMAVHGEFIAEFEVRWGGDVFWNEALDCDTCDDRLFILNPPSFDYQFSIHPPKLDYHPINPVTRVFSSSLLPTI